MTLVLARQIFILGSKRFEHLDFLLLLGRPQNFTTSALIVYEANEAKIVGILLGVPKASFGTIAEWALS